MKLQDSFSCLSSTQDPRVKRRSWSRGYRAPALALALLASCSGWLKITAPGDEYKEDGFVSFRHWEFEEAGLLSEACWEMSCRSADATSLWRSSDCTDGAAGVAGSWVSTADGARGFSVKRLESKTTNQQKQWAKCVCVMCVVYKCMMCSVWEGESVVCSAHIRYGYVRLWCLVCMRFVWCM